MFDEAVQRIPHPASGAGGVGEIRGEWRMASCEQQKSARRDCASRWGPAAARRFWVVQMRGVWEDGDGV